MSAYGLEQIRPPTQLFETVLNCTETL
jgi:hypothetical protein